MSSAKSRSTSLGMLESSCVTIPKFTFALMRLIAKSKTITKISGARVSPWRTPMRTWNSLVRCLPIFTQLFDGLYDFSRNAVLWKDSPHLRLYWWNLYRVYIQYIHVHAFSPCLSIYVTVVAKHSWITETQKAFFQSSNSRFVPRQRTAGEVMEGANGSTSGMRTHVQRYHPPVSSDLDQRLPPVMMIKMLNLLQHMGELRLEYRLRENSTCFETNNLQ